MAQVAYIRFDTDFFDKPKIKGMSHRLGNHSVLFLIRLLCAMGRATKGEISRDAWEAIGLENEYDDNQSRQVIEYCLEKNILGGSLDALTNSRIQEDQAALEKKREATKERVAKARQKQGIVSPIETPAVQPERVIKPVLGLINPNLIPGHVAVEVNTQKVEETFDTSDPNMEIALEKLEKPAGQDWNRDNRFINAGRRPMKDYPLLWLTPKELSDVIKKLEESDIPIQSYKDLFLKAEAKLTTYSAQGRSAQSVSVYNWLTGFLFDELLERTIKETRLAKTMEAPQRYEQRR